MDLKLIYAIILTILPLTELRIGLPLALLYAKESGVSIYLIFCLIILINILLIFFIFYFLDKIHKKLLNWYWYKHLFELYLKKIQKKVKKFEARYEALGFLALVLFVAIPLPITGAWTGCLLSWLLNLDRKKSICSISLGVLLAGIFIFLGTLGFFKIFG